MALKLNQIYNIVNNVAKQAWGENAVQAVDLTGVIAMGNKILSSESDKELFMNTLINRIGKVIISSRPYSGFARNIIKDEMEYGSVIQKIYIEPFEAEVNQSWNIAKGTELSQGVVTPPEAKQYLFEVKDVYQFTVTIPDYQINTAFTNESTLSAFISAIFVSMETSITLSIDNMINMCIANFIGEKIHYQAQPEAKGVHAINLLDLYNKAYTLELTPEDAIKNQDFLRFAGQQIKIHMKRMESMSTIYNTEQLKRHTPSDYMNVYLLTDYASANATYLESDTFNRELVELPGYTEIPYWQGQGTNATFKDVSSIDITTSNGNAVKKSYIIGFIFDREALGVFFNRRKATSFYAPRQEVTQYFEKLDMGYFNDLSENGVVFYLEKVGA